MASRVPSGVRQREITGPGEGSVLPLRETVDARAPGPQIAEDVIPLRMRFRQVRHLPGGHFLATHAPPEGLAVPAESQGAGNDGVVHRPGRAAWGEIPEMDLPLRIAVSQPTTEGLDPVDVKGQPPYKETPSAVTQGPETAI
jgi:hypothetical protein